MSALIPGEKVLATKPNFKCVGMDEYLSEVMSILIRGNQSSVVLTGPKGVGRSTLCLGLQAAKGFDLNTKRFFWLDSDGLFADDKKTEDLWDEVVTTLTRTSDSVLVIEHAADFITSARSGGHDNFVNSLMRMVRDGVTHVIAEVHDDAFDTLVKAHSGMSDLFTVIDVHEPSDGSLLEIVNHVAGGLSEFHAVGYDPDAVVAAIELTTKYRDASRAQPSRAITLVDRAFSAVRLDVHSRISKSDAEEMARISAALQRAEDAVIAAEQAVKAERDRVLAETPGASTKVKAFKQLAGKSADLTEEGKKANDLLAQAINARDEVLSAANAHTERVNATVKLTRAEVVKEFSSITGIPASKLTEDDREKLRTLEARILERIFGQDDAVEHVANMVKTSRVGKRHGGRPKGACMFMGPSGVGKTETAKVLATELFGDERALFRLDMSEYMEKHAVAKLIGAPPGYEGFEAGGILTNGIRKRPVCVLLLDEIEKAHPDVFNVFLQILGDGRLTDNVGRVVSFEDVYVICTTNIGQVHYLDASLTPEVAHERTMRDLDATYRPEFLNRFGGRKDIIHFKSLPLPVIEKIVAREITAIASAYAQEGLLITAKRGEIEKFCAQNYDPRTGARGLPGHLRATLEPAIADLALDKSSGVLNVSVTYDSASKNLVPVTTKGD